MCGPLSATSKRRSSPGGGLAAWSSAAPLFVGADGERITRGTLQNRVQRAFRRAGIDAPARLGAMAHLISAQHSEARVLVASLKSADEVSEALLAGGDDITAAPEVIRALASDPLTDAAVARFAADWERFQRPASAP